MLIYFQGGGEWGSFDLPLLGTGVQLNYSLKTWNAYKWIETYGAFTKQINKQSRQNKRGKGFLFKYQTVSVYESNPFYSGANSTKGPVLKITVAGIPLPVQDDIFF